MAKLRDTAIKDNLAIAGNVTAAGKVLSVEGHTHTPANITGIDKYIEDKVKAGGATLPENIDAKTLDGHAASDFVLKSENSSSSGSYVYSTIISATSLRLQFSDHFKTALYSIKFETEDLIIELDSVTTTKRIVFKRPTMQMPLWYMTDGYSTLLMYNISNFKTKILITVTTNLLINSKDIAISEYTGTLNGYILVPDIRTAMYLG